jgi:hypothetical protein
MNRREKSHAMTRQALRDTATTNAWLAQQGISPPRLADTDTRLIQAEARARQLIKDYKALLTSDQQAYLKNFLRRMEHRHSRQRMREEAGNGIFRMHTQLKRRQHAQENLGTPTVLPTANR